MLVSYVWETLAGIPLFTPTASQVTVMSKYCTIQGEKRVRVRCSCSRNMPLTRTLKLEFHTPSEVNKVRTFGVETSGERQRSWRQADALKVCVKRFRRRPTFLGESRERCPCVKGAAPGEVNQLGSRWPSAGNSGQLQLTSRLGNDREIWRQLDCSLAQVSQRQPTKSPLENRTALAAI